MAVERFVRDPNAVTLSECMFAFGAIFFHARQGVENGLPSIPRDMCSKIQDIALQFHPEGFKELFPEGKTK